jgi:hypothetical protein
MLNMIAALMQKVVGSTIPRYLYLFMEEGLESKERNSYTIGSDISVKSLKHKT